MTKRFSFWLLFAIGTATVVFNSCGNDEPEKKDPGVVIDGIRWATRNVATHGTFVDNPEDHGGLFQWGRRGDGHEQHNSLTTEMLSTSNVPGHGNFIITSASPNDWRSPQNDALWNAGTETAPIKAANDPCPPGWRVPTIVELVTLRDSGSEWTTVNGVAGRQFGTAPNTIFLPAVGRRFNTGMIAGVGQVGYYWSSTVDGILACDLYFNSRTVNRNFSSVRVRGVSVRCVAE